MPTQRPTEPVLAKQTEPSVESVSSEPVVQNIPSKQTEPAAQNVPPEPVKQVLVKDKSPPPPILTEKAQGEPVSVSVEKVSQARTSGETSNSVTSDTTDSREKTPEVNIMPPTPVEKEMKMETQTEVQKPVSTTEVSETPKELTGNV